MSRVSLSSRVAAVETLIRVAQGSFKPRGSELALLVDHARQAVSCILWLQRHPEIVHAAIEADAVAGAKA